MDHRLMRSNADSALLQESLMWKLKGKICSFSNFCELMKHSVLNEFLLQKESFLRFIRLNLIKFNDEIIQVNLKLIRMRFQREGRRQFTSSAYMNMWVDLITNWGSLVYRPNKRSPKRLPCLNNKKNHTRKIIWIVEI